MNGPSVNHVPATGETFRIFVFYDEFPAGIAAKKIADQISELAGTSSATEIEIWKMDSIPVIGPLMNVVLQQAMRVDVLLIAVSQNPPQSATLRWLNYFCSRTTEHFPALLLALRCEKKAGDSEIIQRLADFADRTTTKFLSQKPSAGFDLIAEDIQHILDAKSRSIPSHRNWQLAESYS